MKLSALMKFLWITMPLLFCSSSLKHIYMFQCPIRSINAHSHLIALSLRIINDRSTMKCALCASPNRDVFGTPCSIILHTITTDSPESSESNPGAMGHSGSSSTGLISSTAVWYNLLSFCNISRVTSLYLYTRSPYPSLILSIFLYEWKTFNRISFYVCTQLTQ